MTPYLFLLAIPAILLGAISTACSMNNKPILGLLTLCVAGILGYKFLIDAGIIK